MKKIVSLLMFLLLLIGCKEKAIEEAPKQDAVKTLSDLQVTACNKADEAKTCDTRLAELGIVLKEDCCGVLGKCC